MGGGFLPSSLVVLSDFPSFSIIYLISVISFSSVTLKFFKFSRTLSTGFSIGFSTTTGSTALGTKTLEGNFKAADLTAVHGFADARSG
jgi:hypothetical protein